MKITHTYAVWKHVIIWPFPPFPNPKDKSNKVPKFNPDNFEDAPL